MCSIHLLNEYNGEKGESDLLPIHSNVTWPNQRGDISAAEESSLLMRTDGKVKRKTVAGYLKLKNILKLGKLNGT